MEMEIAEEEAVIVNSSRLKSIVWNDFDRVKKGDTFVAICRHCKRKLSGSSTSGTSHLRNHLIRCRRRSNHDISQLLTRGKKKEGTLALPNISFDQEQRKAEALSFVKFDQGHTRDGCIVNFDNRRSRLDLARMIILHGYPLSMVEHVGFRLFVRSLQPLFDIATFDGVEADCREIYLKERQKVYEELDKLPGKISLSADTWTANGDAEYLCLTAHYIDDSWKLKKKILNFLTIDPSQTEDMLSEVIMTSLRNWDIDRKLFSVTFDNYSAHDIIIGRIREQLCQHRFLYCDGQLFDTRCAANVVKLMVNDTLETASRMIHKVRESVRYVQSSQATQEKFNEMAQIVGVDSHKCLNLDNSFYWNSTYIMIETALECKDVFSLLQEHDSGYTMCPSLTEWNRISAIASFLKLFVEVSSVFAGTKYPTSNTFFVDICDIHLKLIEWCQNSDNFVDSLARKLKSRFDEYWTKCSLALAIAAILDPRYKMQLVEYYFPQIYGDDAPKYINTVSDCMEALYTGHAIYSPLAPDCQVEVSQANNDRLTGYDKFIYETSQSQSVKSDLDKYLEEPLFPRKADISILNWWKVHTPRYPVLSMMARNILGMPMSKDSLEFVFNSGDKALEPHRSSLRSDTLQALMCAQDWMRDEFEDSKASSGSVTLALCYDTK